MSTWVAVTLPGSLRELLLLLANFMCPRTTPVSLAIGLQHMKAHESGPVELPNVRLAKDADAMSGMSSIFVPRF